MQDTADLSVMEDLRSSGKHAIYCWDVVCMQLEGMHSLSHSPPGLLFIARAAHCSHPENISIFKSVPWQKLGTTAKECLYILNCLFVRKLVMRKFDLFLKMLVQP